MTLPIEGALTLLDAGLRGTLVALLALVGALLMRDRPRDLLARIGVVFMAGLVVQVLSSTPAFEAAVPRLWQVPLVAISVGNAVMFWIFVQALFDDDFELRPRHVAAWLLAAALSAFNCATGWDTSTTAGRITVALQHGVPLLCAVGAAVAAASTWRVDLVERRRRLRKFIVLTGVAYTVFSLVARLAAPEGRLLGLPATIDVAALLAMIAVVAVSLLRVGPSDLFAPVVVDAGPASRPAPRVDAGRSGSDEGDASPSLPDPAEERLVATVQRVVRDERVYRVEGLTVAALAGRLAVPEYRLRRVINQRLGYRNFNAFINKFRLDEARQALADPALREQPVLTIALDAGFQSIGPFNRAFKAATGVTPTEFRRQNLADS